jgi:hypothetical protein
VFFKKTSPPRSSDVWVTVEPRAGHTDDEIVTRLGNAGVTEISVLAPGFISAYANTETLQCIEDIADVSVKHRKQTRG